MGFCCIVLSQLSEFHFEIMDKTVCLLDSLSKSLSKPLTRRQIRNNLVTVSPTVPFSLKGTRFIFSKERGRHMRKKKQEEKKTASTRAGQRIAWAPGLSCLYKQALIFLSSPGTSAIYSQLCGWGPSGAGEILLQSSWALEASV